MCNLLRFILLLVRNNIMCVFILKALFYVTHRNLNTCYVVVPVLFTLVCTATSRRTSFVATHCGTYSSTNSPLSTSPYCWTTQHRLLLLVQLDYRSYLASPYLYSLLRTHKETACVSSTWSRINKFIRELGSLLVFTCTDKRTYKSLFYSMSIFTIFQMNHFTKWVDIMLLL